MQLPVINILVHYTCKQSLPIQNVSQLVRISSSLIVLYCVYVVFLFYIADFGVYSSVLRGLFGVCQSGCLIRSLLNIHKHGCAVWLRTLLCNYEVFQVHSPCTLPWISIFCSSGLSPKCEQPCSCYTTTCSELSCIVSSLVTAA